MCFLTDFIIWLPDGFDVYPKVQQVSWNDQWQALWHFWLTALIDLWARHSCRTRTKSPRQKCGLKSQAGLWLIFTDCACSCPNQNHEANCWINPSTGNLGILIIALWPLEQEDLKCHIVCSDLADKQATSRILIVSTCEPTPWRLGGPTFLVHLLLRLRLRLSLQLVITMPSQIRTMSCCPPPQRP